MHTAPLDLRTFDALLGMDIVSAAEYVERRKKPKKPQGTRKLQALENQLQTALYDAWEAGGLAAVDEALAAFAVGKGAWAPEEIGAALEYVASQMSGPLAEALAPEVQAAVTAGYDLGRAAFVKQPVFGLVDEKARAALAQHQTYWIGEHYGEHVGPRIAETVQKEIIEAGLGRADAGTKLREIFEPEFGEKSDDYWRGVAANTVTRSRNMGAIESLNEAGFDEMEIVNPRDEATSDICLYMTSGKIVFKVAWAVGQRDEMLKAKTPTAAKAVSPWLPFEQINGKTAEQLMAMGVMTPPLHMHCRSLIVVR